MTYRIAHPAADGGRKMLRVHPHDAGVVHHLAENHDRILGLHNLMQVVVEIIRQRGRTGRGTEAEQAAFAEGALLRVVESAGRFGVRILALARVRGRSCLGRCEPFARGSIVGRYMAVRRVYHDGRSNLSIHHGECRALLQPEIVVASDGAASGSF